MMMKTSRAGVTIKQNTRPKSVDRFTLPALNFVGGLLIVFRVKKEVEDIVDKTSVMLVSNIKYANVMVTVLALIRMKGHRQIKTLKSAMVVFLCLYIAL
ncbi:hypothetical protein R3D73_004998 [Serratia marcescens]|nr:hypothetical protein [Serratia marcescens]ELQ9442102.1 hypothetical protein [Serratia marcescens]ELT5562892.1 hypothetical protein [Serratia marcescens]